MRHEWYIQWWFKHCDLFPATSFGETPQAIARLADSIEQAFCDHDVTEAEAHAATTYVQRHPPEYLTADKHCSVLLRAIQVARAEKAKPRPKCLTCESPAAEGRNLCEQCIAREDSTTCRWCPNPTGDPAKALCPACRQKNWFWKHSGIENRASIA